MNLPHHGPLNIRLAPVRLVDHQLPPGLAGSRDPRNALAVPQLGLGHAGQPEDVLAGQRRSGMPATSSPFSTRASRSFAAFAFAAVSAANGSRSAIARCTVASSSLCPSMSSVVHLGKRLPEPGVRLGAFELHRLMIVHRRHRDAGVDRGEDRAALCGIDPVAERVEPLVELGPERDAVRRSAAMGTDPRPATCS